MVKNFDEIIKLAQKKPPIKVVVAAAQDEMVLQGIHMGKGLKRVMGISKPKVAALSAVELVTPNIPSTIDAACLSKMSERGQIKDAIVDGPLALDIVFSSEAAKKKGIQSPLGGNVDILLAPNIETASVIFKTLVQFAQYKGIGVFVGTKVPLIQLPREAPPEAKVSGIAATILMMNGMNPI